jgi:glyoxylase-like metal-dependent hydrolase (beta-lactamase superfamily II)
VAITHADPDHHGGAEAIAMTLEVPIFAGRGAATALPYDVTELSDAERLPVGDVELSVAATPGHRADHVGFLSADGWMLAGDVVGQGPARSILREPDITAWQASLDRLETASVRRLLPGHGEPVSDVARAVEETRARLRTEGAGNAQS